MRIYTGYTVSFNSSLSFYTCQ